MTAHVAAGRVWLVGAGPGDPDLITVRGRRLLETADAIVHDRLVDDRLLAVARPDALRVPVGKLGYGRSTPQERIHEALIRLARAGLDVVRLKGGDPFVFGRGGEEVAALRAAGIAVEVVPGVTAGVAGPAAAGIPVTHRHLAHGVVFVAGGPSAGPGGAGASAVDWDAVARIDTIVVYMAGRTSAAVARGLIAAGRSAATPAAIVRDATGPAADHRATTLAALARGAFRGPVDDRPTLLVVGEVVALGGLPPLQPPAARRAGEPSSARPRTPALPAERGASR
jgi:uroporphyrin-III C-methyltransferase/precorrin-2 dehydrogenase/sirohydrochlorin ferrochelatase